MKRKENKMKHTQGKWEVEKTIGYSIKIGDKYIAGVHGQENKIKDDSKALGFRYDDSETIANANLIASSPDMLKILKDAKGVVSLTSPSMADKIKNIIAKAEGK